MSSRTVLGIRSHLPTLSVRSAVTIASPSAEVDPEWSTAKPYSEIPGPKPLPIPKFGNVWRMLPFGPLGNMSLIELHGFLYKEYGPIVKLAGMGRADMIFLYDPQDVEKLFRNESSWPNRPGLECIDYYRRITRYDVYKGNPGIVSSQGEEWHRNRSAVNQPMMKPRNVMSYHQPIQDVASEFVERIRAIRDENQEVSKDFQNELNKWALESISVVALDTRLGCLSPDLKKDSDGQIMIDSVEEVHKLFYRLDMMPSLWPYYSTRNWRKFIKIMNNITYIATKNIHKKMEDIKKRPSEEPQGQSVLESLLFSEGGKFAAVTMALDMMISGIDTTSNSTANALYYLAKNPAAQEKAFQEVCQVLPNASDDLPKDYSNCIPYLKACIKESQRISPLAVGNARKIPKDIVIRGFRIPKDVSKHAEKVIESMVDLVASNMVMCNMEKYFPRPNEYIPERWLKTEKHSPLSAANVNPFVFLPFGFGPRMCIGRRLAELEMHTILAKVLRNFKISYNYEDMEWRSEILNVPNKPLRFKMETRQ